MFKVEGGYLQMGIPESKDMCPSILSLLRDEEYHTREAIIDYCAHRFAVSEDELHTRIIVRGKSELKFENNVAWSLTFLKRANLIDNGIISQWKILDKGIKWIDQKHKDSELIEVLEPFSYKNDSDAGNSTEFNNAVASKSPFSSTSSPVSQMDEAIKQANKQLANELYEQIRQREPAFLERLVIELLGKMGYGGKGQDSGVVTGGRGDHGIDGVINQDPLGFEKIYVQAKCWNKNRNFVGEPEIRDFCGAISGAGGQRGLFITTAFFSKPARDFAEQQRSCKIVLIDGRQLTDLMIEYGLGVSTIRTYQVKAVDSDYFAPEE